MKKTVTTLCAFIITGILCFTACKKSDNSNTNPPTTTGSTTTGGNTPTAQTPSTPSDANGVMVALRLNTAASYSVPGFGTMVYYAKLDGAIAMFPTTAGGSTYQDAGTVTTMSTTLDKQSNNQYQKTQQASQANFGYPSSSTYITWNVSGTASVTAISASAYRLPTYDTTYFGNILTNNTITKANGLSFSILGKVGYNTSSDSVICMIIGGGNTLVKKTVSVLSGAVNFSTSELSVLSNTSTGQFQVTPYTVYPYTMSGGVKYYFISEQAYVKTGVTVN